jgi:hypothetical protein
MISILASFSQEGETAEFAVVTGDDTGRSKAENVTGPVGAFVHGAPRRPQMDYDGCFGGSDNFSGVVALVPETSTEKDLSRLAATYCSILIHSYYPQILHSKSDPSLKIR